MICYLSGASTSRKTRLPPKHLPGPCSNCHPQCVVPTATRVILFKHKVHHVTLSLKALQWLPIHCPKNQIPTLHPDLESMCELTPTSSPTAPPSPLCFSCSAFFWPFNQTSFRLKAFTVTGPIFRSFAP